MPVPTQLSDLSTTASANGPQSTETLSTGDDYIRAIQSIIKRVTTGVDAMTTPSITTLTVTGNTTLGDASTDTLNVGNGGLIKDANGNTGINYTPETGGGNLQVKNYISAVSASTTGGSRVEAHAHDYLSGPSYANCAINYYGKTTAGNISYLPTVAAANAAGIEGINISTLVMLTNGGAPIVFGTNSVERLRITSDGRLYGTALHNNAGSVTGTTNQYIASGTYTPTVSGATNLDSTTPRKAQWMRVGNVVTVSGVIDVDATSTVATSMNLSLPIASTAGASDYWGGSAALLNVTDGKAVFVYAGPTATVMSFLWLAASTSSQTLSYTYSYTVA